jgi:hypothetical protein
MDSDFWKFSRCPALQHLIPFWWFERRDDNQRWQDLEGKQKCSPQKQCKIKQEENMVLALFTRQPPLERAGLSWVRPKCCFFFSNRSSLLHLIIFWVFHSRIHQSPDCIKKGHANLWGDQPSPWLRVHSVCIAYWLADTLRNLRNGLLKALKGSFPFFFCFYTFWGCN